MNTKRRSIIFVFTVGTIFFKSTVYSLGQSSDLLLPMYPYLCAKKVVAGLEFKMIQNNAL
jgi:hypothetical protein